MITKTFYDANLTLMHAINILTSFYLVLTLEIVLSNVLKPNEPLEVSSAEIIELNAQTREIVVSRFR